MMLKETRVLAFKKAKNLACVEVHKSKILIHLPIDPTTIGLEENFTRNVKGIGHYGTGDLQIIMKSTEDFENAKPLIERAYNAN